MSIKRNTVIEIQPYIAEALREQYELTVNTHGKGFAYAVNLILARDMGLDPPKSARELMSERQKARWASEREAQEEAKRKAEAKAERRRNARKAKKAEASE